MWLQTQPVSCQSQASAGPLLEQHSTHSPHTSTGCLYATTMYSYSLLSPLLQCVCRITFQTSVCVSWTWYDMCGYMQVSKNFSDVFQELVPNGKGQLVMKRAEEVYSLRDLYMCMSNVCVGFLSFSVCGGVWCSCLRKVQRTKTASDPAAVAGAPRSTSSSPESQSE